MAGQQVNVDRLQAKSPTALPDSTEPHGPCPRCGRLSNFTVMGNAPVTYDDSRCLIDQAGQRSRDCDVRLSVLECHGCHQNTVVIEEKYVGGVRHGSGGRSGVEQWRGIHWWPTPGMQPSDPDIPAPVAEAIAEGTRCLAVKSPRAAVVMFRGALALIVGDRGSTAAQAQPNLAKQLRQMAADADLDRTLADWADHIRLLGNAGAHPSELAPVSVDEATELASMIASLVEYLYMMPARVQRARSARP